MSPSSDKVGTCRGRAPEIRSRPEAIAKLRAALMKLTDGERSICTVASECRIFCGGFRRWPDDVFSRGWAHALGCSTDLSRPQMERLADIWLLTEQLRLQVP